MPSNRGRRRVGGITVTDVRHDGLGISSASPVVQDFGEIAGAGRDAVNLMLAGITDSGSGRLATEARQAVFTITQQVENAV